MLNIGEGDELEVRSRRGEVRAPARITDSIRPDTLFMPFHYPGLGNANRVTNTALDPISKMPEFKVCAVALSRIGPARTTHRPHRNPLAARSYAAATT